MYREAIHTDSFLATPLDGGLGTQRRTNPSGFAILGKPSLVWVIHVKRRHWEEQRESKRGGNDGKKGEARYLSPTMMICSLVLNLVPVRSDLEMISHFVKQACTSAAAVK